MVGASEGTSVLVCRTIAFCGCDIDVGYRVGTRDGGRVGLRLGVDEGTSDGLPDGLTTASLK